MGLFCGECHDTYLLTQKGQLDLRLKRAKKLEMELYLELSPNEHTDPLIPLPEGRLIEELKGLKPPKHLNRKMLSHVPKGREGSLALDLGCGKGLHKPVCEKAGFRWVGVDISPSSGARVLADAHALPFKPETFEFSLAIALWEHLGHPLVAAREVGRVLKPGGLLLGSVAFLEPFHGNSYYHHTHLGIINVLKGAGFQVEWVSPQERWDALTALSGALFPRAPKWLSLSLIGVIRRASAVWWKTGLLLLRGTKGNGLKKLCYMAGAFVFKASKPYSGN